MPQSSGPDDRRTEGAMGSPATTALRLSILLSLAAASVRADQRPGRYFGHKEMRISDPCKPNAQGKALEPCHLLCRSKVWEWRFWVTNYNVGETYGNGEHQGIGIYGFEYEFDDRHGPEQGLIKQPLWEDETELDNVVARPDERWSKRALCKQPTQIYKKLIYNHGRTLAQGKSKSWWDQWRSSRYPIASLATIDVPAPHWEWSGREGLSERAEKTKACLDKIKDGFCDAVCGNCSYVLPERGQGDKLGRLLDQKMAFPRREGKDQMNVKYVRTTEGKDGNGVPIPDKDRTRVLIPDMVTSSGSASAMEVESKGFRDPFTHCVNPRAQDAQQALSSSLVFWTSDGRENGRVITGLYGHNSNTDAQAGYQAFLQCGRSPDDVASFLKKCEICGDRRQGADGGEEQWPCLDPNPNTKNTAKNEWKEMDQWLKELDPNRNVDDSTLGMTNDPEGNPVPICRGNGHKVYGM